MERLSQGADESSSKMMQREAACDSASFARAHRFRELSLLKARGPLGPGVRSDRYRTVRTKPVTPNFERHDGSTWVSPRLRTLLYFRPVPWQ